MSTARPIAVSMGDPTGIGPEVTLAALRRRALRGTVRPILVGDPAVYEVAAAQLGIRPRLAVWSPPQPLPDGAALAVYPVATVAARDRRPGHPSLAGGRAAHAAILAGVRLVQDGYADALVTAPICKANLVAAGVNAPGHTELLAELCGGVPVRMMMVGSRLRVVLATTHLAIRDVPTALTRRLIRETLVIADAAPTAALRHRAAAARRRRAQPARRRGRSVRGRREPHHRPRRTRRSPGRDRCARTACGRQSLPARPRPAGSTRSSACTTIKGSPRSSFCTSPTGSTSRSACRSSARRPTTARPMISPAGGRRSEQHGGGAPPGRLIGGPLDQGSPWRDRGGGWPAAARSAAPACASRRNTEGCGPSRIAHGRRQSCHLPRVRHPWRRGARLRCAVRLSRSPGDMPPISPNAV